MLVSEIFKPSSIAVIGASDDTGKPGGRLLKNLIEGNFNGKIYPVNPKRETVQGLQAFSNTLVVPVPDLAILAIPAEYCLQAVKDLTNRGSKAFIILSAGFKEFSNEGAELEKELKAEIDSVGGTLIGPNCIGVLNSHYQGVFAGIIPKLDPQGCDFVSSSGATIAFVLDYAVQKGLKFSNILSTGNAAQTSAEDVLKYWDESYDPLTSSKVKLMYLENILDPDLFQKHASSLIRKGCSIVAIKAGTTDAGSRAVSSHTGALANSDKAVDALFKKAGVIRVYDRVGLIYVASVLMHGKLKGNRIAVITHAGGSGVMITDTLTAGGMEVPAIEGPAADELLSKLHTGSSVSNPIDFLATGTAEQLEQILDAVENDFDHIDASVVIFGSTGMFDVTEVYEKLFQKMHVLKKPVYPVLPSISIAEKEVKHFIDLGGINFLNEVSLGRAISRVYNTPEPAGEPDLINIDKAKIRSMVEKAVPGFQSPDFCKDLFDIAGIPRVREYYAKTEKEAIEIWNDLQCSLAMKVVGPVHKSDVGGVELNVAGEKNIKNAFNKLISIKDATSVLMQPMASGLEIFLGAKYEKGFGHVILFGLGGIFVEVMKDISSALGPLSRQEALNLIQSVKSYPLIKGYRGKGGVDIEKLIDIILRFSTMLRYAPEILEIDINPLLGDKNGIVAVDSRVKI